MLHFFFYFLHITAALLLLFGSIWSPHYLHKLHILEAFLSFLLFTHCLPRAKRCKICNLVSAGGLSFSAIPWLLAFIFRQHIFCYVIPMADFLFAFFRHKMFCYLLPQSRCLIRIFSGMEYFVICYLMADV